MTENAINLSLHVCVVLLMRAHYLLGTVLTVSKYLSIWFCYMFCVFYLSFGTITNDVYEQRIQ